MKIIKECNGTYIVLRSNTYGSQLSYFDKLFREAKKTFPSLKKSEVQVVHFGGISYKHTFGIEFRNPIEPDVPEGYFPISQLELTL